MTGIRKQVTSAMASLLTPKASTWQSVLQSRIQSSRQLWPYVMIYSSGDIVEDLVTDDPALYLRAVDVSVIGMIRVTDPLSIEDDMDAISVEIESRLINSSMRSLIPNFESMSLVSTTLEVIITDDDQIDHAEVLVTYRVVATSSENDPATLI
jgi:hypothetical protein